ncbi:hypothetical protein [Spartinivicinus poritis]|uniref:NADH dehydrogenase subunit 6 n=1 Tax=Spartinivicinus poritis TaxID=2994640 RepID=A0ABT5UDK2_9GAMM|nr:hypothetical protein [Spartinivicinus sp. A2-2]MDE1464435.1 hypothetical protein [Spartinivicinus sp. A2-2]
MSINELLSLIAEYQLVIVSYFISLPVVSYILLLMYKRTAQLNWVDYFLSVLVYLASIPGIISFSLIFYTLFIIRGNLLEVNALVYFLPVVSMVLVFVQIARKTDFEHLPGFGRLSGLMLMMLLTCIVVLVLQRLHFFVGFFASIESLIVIAVIIFTLFKIAGAKIMNKHH